jgi:hypothetical protein
MTGNGGGTAAQARRAELYSWSGGQAQRPVASSTIPPVQEGGGGAGGWHSGDVILALADALSCAPACVMSRPGWTISASFLTSQAPGRTALLGSVTVRSRLRDAPTARVTFPWLQRVAAPIPEQDHSSEPVFAVAPAGNRSSMSISPSSNGSGPADVTVSLYRHSNPLPAAEQPCAVFDSLRLGGSHGIALP